MDVSWSTGSAPDLERRVPFVSRYIVSPGFDWIFFIGSPLIATAVVLGAVELLPHWTVKQYVLVYMALGHHVPTFLRAYGDPDEFQRNRWRLVAVPLLVVPVLAAAYWIDARIVGLIFVWDQYHFVRQNYGMMRIYDTKAGVRTKRRGNLDHWLCFSAFVAIVSHSDFYTHTYAETFFDLGLAIPGWVGSAIGTGSLFVTAVVAVLYAGDLWGRLVRGEPVALPKLAIFATTYGVWYFAYVTLSDPFLSYPISSFFHCLQYDAFAWSYGRRKAWSAPPSGRGAAIRYLYQGRSVWLYVLAVLAYGAVSQLGRGLYPILVLNASTGVLHYYFDAFIWKVRRDDFKRYL